MILLFAFLSFLIISAYVALIVRWNKAWNKIPEDDFTQNKPTTKLTVIIPVRNEAANIEQVLNSIYQQDYPKHLVEIIVSDDHSDDETISIAKNFFATHNDTTGVIIEANSNSVSKKEAIKKAIGHANGELLITTDADCTHHPQWLQMLSNYFSLHKPVMICGLVMMKGNDSFLQQFQTMDYLSLQVCGAASLALTKPLLCSGANLAFTKKAFDEVNGYDDNVNIASGDDTFLMLKMNEKFPDRVRFIKSQKAIVTTSCSTTLKSFLHQRTRWVSKTNYYSNSFIKALGGFIFLVNCFFLVLLMLSFYNPFLFYLMLVYFFIKTIADYILLANAAKFFAVSIYKFGFLIMECIYPVYLLALLSGIVNGSYQWKMRKHNT